jgi:small subunit ribosomal protein S14
MAKKSSIEKNKRRERMAKRFGAKRAKLKAIAGDRALDMEQRFEAAQKLAELPRNSSRVRVRLRCELPHGPPGPGPHGPDPRHGQGELVRRVRTWR